jgi:stringent starvation protein B
MSPESQGSPTRPYLIRALHDWCTDNGFTPYLAVYVDGTVQVPMEYVKNREIVLNVSFEATSGLQLGNEFVEFKARFGGIPRDIVVPIDHVVAIYARENGQGMAFPAPADAGPAPALEAVEPAPPAESTEPAASRQSAPIISLAGGEAAPAPRRNRTPVARPAVPGGDDPVPPAPAGRGRPALKRVK